MRRPVSVKSVFLLPPCEFLVFEPGRHLSPSFHLHSLLSDFRSVQVGRPHFSRCCYLIIDLSSYLVTVTAPVLSRSHLNSAVDLSTSVRTLRDCARPFLAVRRVLSDLSAY